MKKLLHSALIIICFSQLAYAQAFSYGDHWYDNPLGFDPVNLHTKNGFLIPAIAVGIILLTTQRDSLADRVEYFNESGLSWGYKYPYTSLFQNNTGIQFYLRKWMAVGVDMGFYFPKDSFNSTMGISVRPFFRFYPLNNDRYRFYFESGGGLIYFREEFPKPTDRDSRLGTNWNGTTRYGLGGEINLNKNISVLLGIRHVHVSNGDTKGSERNPSHDSNGFFLGLSYRPSDKD